MNTQQVQKAPVNVPRTIGNSGWWLGFGLLLLVAALATYAVSRRAPAPTVAGSPIQAQTVPDAAVQSVTDYLRAHSIGQSIQAQTVPDAAVQSVMDYLRAHGK
jgi:hypothetical protein